MLVTGDITVAVVSATQAAFKNCAPVKKCITKIDETTVDDAGNSYLSMAIYNLTDYSSNYSETIGILWFC